MRRCPIKTLAAGTKKQKRAEGKVGACSQARSREGVGRDVKATIRMAGEGAADELERNVKDAAGQRGPCVGDDITV